MTAFDPPEDETEFNEALNALIERAQDNGVNVEGAWKCTIDGNGNSHWDIQITSVRYSLTDDE